MARNNKRTFLIISLIALFVSVATVAGGGLIGWGKVQEQQVTQNDAIECVKKEGCLLARKHEIEIAILKTRQETIANTVSENNQMLKELIKNNH